MARIQNYNTGIVSGDDKILGQDGSSTSTFTINDLATYINDNYQVVGGITLGSFSLVTNPASGDGSLTYNASNGVFTFTPADAFSGSYNDLTDKPFIFGGDYQQLSNKPTIPTYLTDLQIAQGSAGQYLQSNGDGTFTFAAVTGDGVGIQHSDLSVTTSAANAGGSLSYDANTGVFTFVPADIPTVPTDINQLADSTNVIPADVSDLTDTTNLIPAAFINTMTATAAGGAYYIDGNIRAVIVLAPGLTYKIDTSDSSMMNHPIRFSTTADGTHGGGTQYTTGITTTGVAGQAASYITVQLEQGHPILYYYCGNHSGMGAAVADLTS